jgi:YHS domain-containing protein
MKLPARGFVILLSSLLSGALLLAVDKPAASTQPAASNKKCPISGDDVSPTAKTATYKGKTIGFCCDDCVALFNKNPDKYADKIK